MLTSASTFADTDHNLVPPVLEGQSMEYKLQSSAERTGTITISPKTIKITNPATANSNINRASILVQILKTLKSTPKGTSRALGVNPAFLSEISNVT